MARGLLATCPSAEQSHWGGPCGVAHRPAESRLKAMAVPITSCMSEPMMAISIMSQSSTRGTWRGQGTVRYPSPKGGLGPGLSGHSLQGGDPCPCHQAAAGHPEQHGDPGRHPPAPASPMTQSWGARWILNPSLPHLPIPAPVGAKDRTPLSGYDAPRGMPGQTDVSSPPFGDLSFSQILIACSPPSASCHLGGTRSSPPSFAM